jgi:SM-20-related protein
MEENKIHQLIERIAKNNWTKQDNFLPVDIAEEILDEIRYRWHEDDFKKAGVGRADNFDIRPEIRTDKILWLNPNNLSKALKYYWDIMEDYKLQLNQAFFLSLVEFEAHLAVYPVGSFYKKHLDQFKNVQHRLITCIFYLNKSWDEINAGQLRIYNNDFSSCTDIFPEFNSFVSFRSDLVYHEVLPTKRERYTVSGWLRVRSNMI